VVIQLISIPMLVWVNRFLLKTNFTRTKVKCFFVTTFIFLSMPMTLRTNLANDQTSTWTGPWRHSSLAWNLVTLLEQKLYSVSNFYFYFSHSPRVVHFNYSFRCLLRCFSSLMMHYTRHKKKKKKGLINQVSCKFKYIIHLDEILLKSEQKQTKSKQYQ
jgi:hypothetical protein